MSGAAADLAGSPFTGLSAFPLTPLRDDAVDEYAFASVVSGLAASGVDSITALVSTGCAAYLTSAERERVGRLALEHAGSVPVIVGMTTSVSTRSTRVPPPTIARASAPLVATVTW